MNFTTAYASLHLAQSVETVCIAVRWRAGFALICFPDHHLEHYQLDRYHNEIVQVGGNQLVRSKCRSVQNGINLSNCTTKVCCKDVDTRLSKMFTAFKAFCWMQPGLREQVIQQKIVLFPVARNFLHYSGYALAVSDLVGGSCCSMDRNMSAGKKLRTEKSLVGGGSSRSASSSACSYFGSNMPLFSHWSNLILLLCLFVKYMMYEYWLSRCHSLPFFATLPLNHRSWYTLWKASSFIRLCLLSVCQHWDSLWLPSTEKTPPDSLSMADSTPTLDMLCTAVASCPGPDRNTTSGKWSCPALLLHTNVLAYNTLPYSI